MNIKKIQQATNWLERATSDDYDEKRLILTCGITRPDGNGEISVAADGYRLHALWHERGALDTLSAAHDDYKLIYFEGSALGQQATKYPVIDQTMAAIVDQPAVTFSFQHLYTLCKQYEELHGGWDAVKFDFDSSSTSFRADLDGTSIPFGYQGEPLDGYALVKPSYIMDALSYFQTQRATTIPLRFNPEKLMFGFGTPGKAFAVVMGMRMQNKE